MREFKIGDVVQHFKRELLKPEEKMHNEYLYKILNFAMHTETGEKMVIYKALYEPYDVFARPYDMFISEVDHEKYPNVNQKYRLEVYIHANDLEGIEAVGEPNVIFIPWVKHFEKECFDNMKSDSRVIQLIETDNCFIQSYGGRHSFDNRLKTIQIDNIWARVVGVSVDGISIKCAGPKGSILWELLYKNNFQGIYANLSVIYQTITPGPNLVDCIYLIYKSENESNIL